MKSEEVFELVNLTPELDPVILAKTTPEFWLFWVKTFGRVKKGDDSDAYWEKCAFVFIGWLGAKEHTKEMGQSLKLYLEENFRTAGTFDLEKWNGVDSYKAMCEFAEEVE